MAGAGSRFVNAGYIDPKPLICIHDIPMIQLVIENLRPNSAHKFIFICQRAHVDAYDLAQKLAAWAPGCALVQIDGITEGAACTVLAAKELINSDDALMIANSDQYIDISIDAYLRKMATDNLDGLIMTMEASDPKWSFVGLTSEGLVGTVVEKEVISNEATVGIYNFRHGRDFVKAAELMIEDNSRVNNEFYVAPTYNKLIEMAKRVGIYSVGSVGNGMHGLGTPADLDLFLELPLSKVALNKIL
jgi:dTDP-glucose pyrophosphorylase